MINLELLYKPAAVKNGALAGRLVVVFAVIPGGARGNRACGCTGGGTQDMRRPLVRLVR